MTSAIFLAPVWRGKSALEGGTGKLRSITTSCLQAWVIEVMLHIKDVKGRIDCILLHDHRCKGPE